MSPFQLRTFFSKCVKFLVSSSFFFFFEFPFRLLLPFLGAGCAPVMWNSLFCHPQSLPALLLFLIPKWASHLTSQHLTSIPLNYWAHCFKYHPFRCTFSQSLSQVLGRASCFTILSYYSEDRFLNFVLYPCSVWATHSVSSGTGCLSQNSMSSSQRSPNFSIELSTALADGCFCQMGW